MNTGARSGLPRVSARRLDHRDWSRFLTAWWERYGSKAVSAGQLAGLAAEHGLLPRLLGDGGRRSKCIRLGRTLGTVRAGLHVTWDAKHKRKLYALALLGDDSAGPAAAPAESSTSAHELSRAVSPSMRPAAFPV